ncbi:YchJ family protein [Limnohabitans sp. Jir72]|uniref:YchJ family protein n=1 Tax=Limnohabitans sp. Jir72 TaxID=1977909 RepID=UPI000D3700CA|nr:YchJ family metal-binding protein [Limnohabitans sp. Jir72]
MNLTHCPCGRAKGKSQALSFEACCAPHHISRNAPDAESLMRSRYTAFVLGDAPYLLATWHSSQRPASLVLETGTKWLGLEIKQHRSTGEHTAEVEFVARFRTGGKAVRQHERSRFVREDGRWYYVDGDVL